MMKPVRMTMAIWLALGLSLSSTCLSQTPGPATVVKVSGDVKIEKDGKESVAAAPDQVLAEGDKVRTGPGGSAALKLGDGNTIELQENSQLQVGGAPPKADAEKKPAPPLNLLDGSILCRLKNVPKDSKVTIGTSTSIAGIEGTTFSVSAWPDNAKSSIAVMEGAVLVESRGESNKEVVVGARKITWVSEWKKTTLTATGAGVPSGRYRPMPVFRNDVQITVVRAKGTGRTQAEAARDAREVLSARILRAKIGPEQTVADFLVGKDDAYARLAAFVGAAAILPATTLPDGAVEVVAEVNISDVDRVLEQKVPIFEGAVVPVDEMKYSMTFGARERLTAERAATLDAQRKLVETIQGAYITSETTIQDFALKDDVIKSKVEGLLRGAETLGALYFSDGTVEVTLGVRGAAVVTEINRAAQKDVLGLNYLSKPVTMGPSEFDRLRSFDAAQ